MHPGRNTTVHGANNPGHYTWSPFVTKLEFRLCLANISYQHGTGSPLSGPKGKISYVELSWELIDRGLLPDMATLPAKDIAHHLSIQALPAITTNCAITP
jgi:hypothetical protein